MNILLLGMEGGGSVVLTRLIDFRVPLKSGVCEA